MKTCWHISGYAFRCCQAADACGRVPQDSCQASKRCETPEISCVVQAETDFCYNVLENTEQLQEQLYREMRGRIQEADQSAPIRQEEQRPAISPVSTLEPITDLLLLLSQS